MAILFGCLITTFLLALYIHYGRTLFFCSISIEESSQLAFLAFSAESKRGQTLCFAYFLTFSAEPKRKDNLYLISLHLLLNLNVWIPLALPSLFPYVKCWP